MKKGFKQMVAEASGEVQTWTVSEAMAAVGRPDVAFVLVVVDEEDKGGRGLLCRERHRRIMRPVPSSSSGTC